MALHSQELTPSVPSDCSELGRQYACMQWYGGNGCVNGTVNDALGVGVLDGPPGSWR